jgi:hypothetical protein
VPDYLINVIANRNEVAEPRERLVRAKNQAAALAHVVADTVTIERASTEDIIRLTKAGVEQELVL